MQLQLYNPIQRTSGVFNVLFNCITSYIIPNITLIIIILCYFLYQNIYVGTIFLIGNLSIILYLYATIYFIIDKYKKHDDLLIDTELYIKKSNIYIFYYNWVLENRSFGKGKIYNNEILELINSTFYKSYSKTPVFLQNHFNEVLKK